MGRPLVVYVIISHNPWGCLPTFQQGENKLRWITLDIFKNIRCFWLIFCCLSCQRQGFRSIYSIWSRTGRRMIMWLDWRNICPIYLSVYLTIARATSCSVIQSYLFISCLPVVIFIMCRNTSSPGSNLISLWGAEEDIMKPVCSCLLFMSFLLYRGHSRSKVNRLKLNCTVKPKNIYLVMSQPASVTEM